MLDTVVRCEGRTAFRVALSVIFSLYSQKAMTL